MARAAFNPERHTAENREAQIDQITGRYPDVVFVGSVGRAAILGIDAPVARDRHNREVRDIDVTNTSRRLMDFSGGYGAPFPVDLAFGGLIGCRPGQAETEVCYDHSRPEVVVAMDSTLFEPYPVIWGNNRFSTFHPDTMRHLHLIYNNKRRKDRLNLIVFNLALAAVRYTRIPESKFEPLLELQNMVRRDRELRHRQNIERLQAKYSDTVPLTVQKYADPLLKGLKQYIGLPGRHALLEELASQSENAEAPEALSA